MTRVIVVVVAAVLLGTLGIFVAARDDPVTPATGDARAACREAERFEEIVEAEGLAADARQHLTRAIANAEAAAARDATWVPLQSGLETLEIALEKDDAGAANVGLRVVRAQCTAAEAAQ